MRSRRTTPLTRLVAPLTLATLAVPAGLVGLAGCSDAPEAAPPAVTTTVTVTPTPTPDPVPAVDPEPTVTLDPLDWTSPPRYGQPIDIRRYRDGYLGLETQGVARLTAKGKEIWHWTPVTKDDLGSFFAGDVPVVEPRLRGGLHDVIALDPDTGRQLWSTPSNGYATADDERVFVTTCTGEVRDDSSGTCTMTGRDARTGAVLWTNALGVYTENTNLMSGRILVQKFVDGDSRFFTVDAATGAVLDDDLADGEGDYFLWAVGDADDRLLASTPVDRDPKGGCQGRVDLYDVDGTRLWSRTIEVTRERFRPRTCDELYAYDAEGDIAVSGLFSPTYLLDGETGRTIWHTKRSYSIEAAAGGVLVVEPATYRGPASVALDLRTGEERWTYPEITGGWRAYGDYLYSNSSAGCPQESCSVVLDARTGETVAHVEGIPEQVLPPLRRGGRPQLMLRVELKPFYTTRFGLATLPRLPRA